MTWAGRSLHVPDSGQCTAMDSSNDEALGGVRETVGHVHAGAATG